MISQHDGEEQNAHDILRKHLLVTSLLISAQHDRSESHDIWISGP